MSWVSRARARIREDVDAAIARDPAAASRSDVLLNSPGLHAIWAHRLSHRLWQSPGTKPVARLISTATRAVTGVEIHPGAEIGRGGYVAQSFAAPGKRIIRLDGATETRTMDVRLYTYDGQILLTAARLYQGQTTNFRTPGGGFAPVLAL